MKKLFAFALCMATVGFTSAQKANVESAKKLAGKLDKIEEARTLIKEALSNPETANNVETYVVAGDIEFKAFENQLNRMLINPNDDKVNKVNMGEQLVNAYNYYMQALPFDSLPNEKGQIKPKHSKGLIDKLEKKHGYFYQGAADLYDAKKYLPGAYDSFMIYGDMSIDPRFDTKKIALPDSVRGQSYWYAGLSAWSANNLKAAAKAFKKARKSNFDQPDTYIYEIACWQNLAQIDSTLVDLAKANIYEIAEDGYSHFGISQPLFINNLINTRVTDGDFKGALAKMDELIATHPDNANLYGLRGFVNDRAGNDEASEKDYRKATSLPDVDFETLKNAAKKIFRDGQKKWNEMDPSNGDARQALKEQYFIGAMEIAKKAEAMNPNDSDNNYIIENIQYALDTYFK